MALQQVGPTKRGNGEGTCFQRKDGTWQASVSLGKGLDGKRKRLSAYGRSRRQVQERLLQKQVELAHRRRVVEAYGGDETVSSWASEYLSYAEHSRGLKFTTLEIYRNKLDTHVLPALGHHRLVDLTGDHINDAMRKWAAAGMSPRLRAMCFGTLRSLLVYAVKRKKLASSPHLDADRLRHAEAPLKQLWNDNERARFLGWARANVPLYAPLYFTALATGARLGELLGLQWEQVDLSAGAIRIDRQLNETRSGVINAQSPTRSPKTPKAVRTIAMDPGLSSLLAAHLADAKERDARKPTGRAGPAGFVFSGMEGGPMTRGNVTRRFRLHAGAAGVPVLPFHALRHASATALIEGGLSPKLVQQRLGHASLEITLGVYGHLTSRMERAGAAAADALVGLGPAPMV